MKLKFQKAQQAYAILADAAKRAEYDARFGINRHLRVEALKTSQKSKTKNERKNETFVQQEQQNNNDGGDETEEEEEEEDYQPAQHQQEKSSHVVVVKENEQTRSVVVDDEWAALF